MPLYYWSIWLTIVWCGWWGAALTARLGPSVLKRTLGVIAPELRHYIAYVKAVQFYAGAAGWALSESSTVYARPFEKQLTELMELQRTGSRFCRSSGLAPRATRLTIHSTS